MPDISNRLLHARQNRGTTRATARVFAGAVAFIAERARIHLCVSEICARTLEDLSFRLAILPRAAAVFGKVAALHQVIAAHRVRSDL